MPELPEVETIKKGLEKYLVGHKILKVTVNNPKVFSGSPKNLVGGKIKGVRRFAKVLSIDLSNGYSIVSHIKLTGQFIYRGPKLKNPPNLSKKIVGGVPGRHTHVIFDLDREGALYYNDVRRFGWIKEVKTSQVEEIPFIKKLGPEPFGKLTFELFNSVLSKSSRPIKIVLMDQEKIGGVGNIYANDALWLSKINPKKAANSLTPEAKKDLYDAIHKVLKEGIKYGGSSELAYVTPDGKEGSYQDHTLAYGREGEPCERCHRAKFVKYFLGGRGTYACPVCQK
jgi:formamidopyrimidine-DNA glycosylase